MADINDEKEQLKVLEDLYGENKFSEAVAICEKLSEDFPDSFQIKLLHGKSLTNLDRLDDAENVLVELCQAFPDNITLLQEVGDLYSKKENYEKALEYFDKILFLDPFNSKAKQSIDRDNKILKQTGPPVEGPAEADVEEEVKGEPPEEVEEKEIVVEGKKPIVIDLGDEKQETDEAVKEEVKPPEPETAAEVEEPEEKKEEAVEVPPDGESEFITESAAELYLTQGLFDDALSIYEKLYTRNKEERFAERIIQIKEKRVGQKKIEKLTELLEQIQKKGEEFV